jgi:hypothetical protein
VIENTRFGLANGRSVRSGGKVISGKNTTPMARERSENDCLSFHFSELNEVAALPLRWRAAIRITVPVGAPMVRPIHGQFLNLCGDGLGGHPVPGSGGVPRVK